MQCQAQRRFDLKMDGYEPSELDRVDLKRHQAQLTGQFLIDRHGIVRNAYIECAREGLTGFGDMPPKRRSWPGCERSNLSRRRRMGLGQMKEAL
jgi:hypothetical protein